MNHTHIAFSDESYITASRFRGIAVISLPAQNLTLFNDEISVLLKESSVSEFKWHKLSSGRMRLAAEKMVDKTISWIRENRCRVDALVWDTQDSRHDVNNRDDLENMKRMYFHLLNNVMKKRWGTGTVWRLHPDEHDAIEWEEQKSYLKDVSLETKIHPPNLFNDELILEVQRLFGIEKMEPCKSELNPLIQLADLFAGISVFSRAKYDDYFKWTISNPENPSLFENSQLIEREKESCSDRERFKIIRYLNNTCKHHKLGVSLRTTKGFITMNPNNKLNVWLYKPQHQDDVAPTNKNSNDS